MDAFLKKTWDDETEKFRVAPLAHIRIITETCNMKRLKNKVGQRSNHLHFMYNHWDVFQTPRHVYINTREIDTLTHTVYSYIHKLDRLKLLSGHFHNNLSQEPGG